MAVQDHESAAVLQQLRKGVKIANEEARQGRKRRIQLLDVGPRSLYHRARAEVPTRASKGHLFREEGHKWVCEVCQYEENTGVNTTM